jgi:hypothetical protein
MQMVKKIVLPLFVIWFSLLVFMPKKEIYFALEKVLLSQDIEVNEEVIESTPFTLVLKGMTFYVKGIRVAKADEAEFFTLLAYSRLTVRNIVVDKSLRSMLPPELSLLQVTHFLVDPLHLRIFAKGSFGTVEGSVSLKEHMVHLDFVEAKDIRTIKSNLKKGEKGWYYESSF